MKVVIRLLKSWVNGPDTWPEGQILQLDPKGAESLISKGIAEKYEPNPETDVIIASPVKADSGMTKEDVRNIILEINKSQKAFNANVGDTQQERYLATGGFKSMSHFAYDVYKSTVSRNTTETLMKWNQETTKIEKASGLSEGVGADGGFAVPTEYRNLLMRNALEASVLLGRATSVPMATNSVEIPVIKESTHATSVYGGIIVYRVAEAASITASKPAFAKVRLQLIKFAALAYVTNELLEDSPITMEPLLGQMFSEAIAFQIDEDMVNGNGAGQFLGVLNAPCTVSVTKETAQTAATIVTENVLKMWARLMARAQGNAIWIANMDTFPQLAALAMTVGTGGAPAGLLQVATNGVTGRPMMSLLGAPLFLTEHCQTLGTAGDIICGDWKQYLIGQKAGGSVAAATSVHLKFVEDEVAFRFTLRMDGQPWMQSALTPKHSSNTLSSFVTLGARA